MLKCYLNMGGGINGLTDRSFHKWNSCQSRWTFISTWMRQSYRLGHKAPALSLPERSDIIVHPSERQLSGSDRPPLLGRNNKIIPTMTIILPTSTSSAAPSPSVFSHPSNLIYVHTSLSDLSPVCPPTPQSGNSYPRGHRSALHIRMSPNTCRRHIQGVSNSDRTALKFLNYHFCGFYVFIRDFIDNSPDSHASLAVPPPDIRD